MGRKIEPHFGQNIIITTYFLNFYSLYDIFVFLSYLYTLFLLVIWDLGLVYIFCLFGVYVFLVERVVFFMFLGESVGLNVVFLCFPLSSS